MPLTKAQKKLVLQKVHCTKYLKPTHGIFHLEHNKEDNCWYYKNSKHENLYIGKATKNPNTWKHNTKYELVEKSFTGVVVKIQEVNISTLLGVYEKNTFELNSCNLSPAKRDGCKVLAATVYFKHGCKRIVPLDAIEEYEFFTNGEQTQNICDNLNQFVFNSPHLADEDDEEIFEASLYSKNEIEDIFSDNIISLKDDGTIEIQNNYLCLNPQNAELTFSKRYLILNVKKRFSRTFADKDNEWFYISDDECDQIMEIMNNQMKEECGFIPDLWYGTNNFDRVVNFANHPFAPELNCFPSMFRRYTPGTMLIDNKDREFIIPSNFEYQFKTNQSAVKEFITLFNIPYTNKTNKIFLKGHRDFLEYVGILELGFNDETLIHKIIDADTNKLISKFVTDNCTLGTYTDNSNNQDQKINLMFNRTGQSTLFDDIKFLFRSYNQNTVAKLLIELIKEKDSYFIPDTLNYFKILFREGSLTPAIISKIGKEGFTEYNHDLLMRIYIDTHPEPEEKIENQLIEYDQAEQKLCWQYDDYEFCLPEDTNKLVEIGSKMNICVGHLYREKAVSKKSTIVYAIKDNVYELCIEVQKTKDAHFKLIQKSAFSNKAPQGKTLEAFNQWCFVKGIC